METLLASPRCPIIKVPPKENQIHVTAVGFPWLPVLLGCRSILAAARAGRRGHVAVQRSAAEAVKEKYGFDADRRLADHLQLSSVRFTDGGSGSFVSPDGLVMTNHHSAPTPAEAQHQGALPDAAGFYARTPADELKCPDSELNVLVSIEDVTARVNAAVAAAASPRPRTAPGGDEHIEKESFDQTGLRSDVVTLYHGGQYHFYRYKKYTDVRLVFAPEHAIAFFGGDPDNFEYPRYDLDICFFRVYENGKPARRRTICGGIPGLKEGDLVFVAGNPGSTDRLNHRAAPGVSPRLRLPASLDLLRRREVLLTSFSERSAKNARRAKDCC